jgi:hypothetical protein
MLIPDFLTGRVAGTAEKLLLKPHRVKRLCGFFSLCGTAE